MHVEFDKNGNPSFAIGNKSILNFQNPEEVPTVKTGSSTEESEPDEVGSIKYIPWYDDNDFPSVVHQTIDESPVLKRALIMSSKITAGQGVFPTRVLEYNSDGSEKLEVIKDPELDKLLRKHMIRRYLAKCGYDLDALYNAFVKLVPNVNGDKILRLVPINARHCRLAPADPKTGKIQNVYVHGDWENAEANAVKTYILLDEDDPEGHLLELKESGLLKKAPVVMQLKGDFTGNDYYAMPPWYSAKKWVDIAGKVAKIIDSGMDNMLNIFIHLQIPYKYWEKKYPEDEFENKQERNKKIQEDIETLEEKLTTSENARKTLITFFGADEGDSDDKWEINVVESKFSQENFVTSTAADTQTAIASGVMPDLMGLMYGNSKGGSMQRELLLIQYALSWLDRQMLADPIEIMLRFNDSKYEDIELRFRNTFLTTLDSGQATQTKMS